MNRYYLLALRGRAALVVLLASVTLGPTSASLPHPAVAYAASTAVTMPMQWAQSKGAKPLEDRDLSARLGNFFREFAAEFKTPASQEDAQLLIWAGANYKAGRAAFNRTALQKSLQGAGFTYRDLDSHSVATNIFAQEYGLAAYDENAKADRPVTLAMGDDFRFFIAKNPQTGTALAGMWIDQTEAGQCLLALAPLGDVPVKRVSLPAVSGANVVLVKDISNVMKGVAPPLNPSFTPRAARRGYATGQVKDMGGRPLAGASISIASSAAGGFRTSVTTKTNAQGIYSIVLPVGVCQIVDAYARIVYNGKAIVLPLRPVDGRLDYFPSQQGHVENFSLQTWGVADSDRAANDPKSGEYYFGAQMRVQWFKDGLPEDGTIEMTLRPLGPLLDGSTGRTFVIRWPTQGDTVLMADYFVNNIPIGRYEMTAKVLDDGDSLPLNIDRVFHDSPLVEKLVIDFQSSSTDTASQERSGVARYDVILKP